MPCFHVKHSFLHSGSTTANCFFSSLFWHHPHTFVFPLSSSTHSSRLSCINHSMSINVPLYFQCPESWVTTEFHQLPCRWQNKCLKMFGASKAEGRENISWLRGIKLLFQKLLKCTFFIWLEIGVVNVCHLRTSWPSRFPFTEMELERSLCTGPRKETNTYWNTEIIILKAWEHLVFLLWYNKQLPKVRSTLRWNMVIIFFPRVKAWWFIQIFTIASSSTQWHDRIRAEKKTNNYEK